MPGPPKVTTVCGTSSGTKARCGGLVGHDVGYRRQLGLRRQAAEGLVEQLAERIGVDVADHGDAQRILGDDAADVVLQVGDLDGRHAVERAGGRPAHRDDRRRRASRNLRLGQRRRIGGFAAQVRDHLGADALDVLRLEPRRGQRQPQQVVGLVLVVLEHAQRAAEVIAGRREAELDGAALEPLVKGLGIEIAGALVEQAGDQIADAGLAGRVLAGAAAEGIFHRDQRHGRVLHEPGFDAAGRHQPLDLGRGVRRRRCQRQQRGAGASRCSAARRVRE